MKKLCAILLTISIIAVGVGLFMKYRTTQETIEFTDPMAHLIQENANFIDRVLALCEGDDGKTYFAYKAYNMVTEYDSWLSKNKNLFDENPTLKSKIDEAWMEIIYKLSKSLENDSNDLTKEKKSAVIAGIASRLDKDALEKYLTERMAKDNK